MQQQILAQLRVTPRDEVELRAFLSRLGRKWQAKAARRWHVRDLLRV